MNASGFALVLRDNRRALIQRWERQFAANATTRGPRHAAVPKSLFPAAFDDIVAMFAAGAADRIPPRRHAATFARLADFPRSAALCLSFFESGAQVIGVFIVGNAGALSAWTASTRNRLLGELDAIIHTLARREIETLRGMCLAGMAAAGDGRAESVTALFGNHAPPAACHRN